MTTLLLVHVAGGAAGILTGFAALAVRKGGTLHRRIGIVFFCAMLVMAGGAAALSLIGEPNGGNVLQAVLTVYLMTTALLTVRSSGGTTWRDVAAMLVGLAVALTHFTFGFIALRSPDGMLFDYPAPMFFVFGSIAALSVLGDVRVLRAGGVRGPRRIARHLWRMCFALFIASGSFFLGQADELPESIRIWPVLVTLALLPLGALLYWLWRVRVRGNLRGLHKLGLSMTPKKAMKHSLTLAQLAPARRANGS